MSKHLSDPRKLTRKSRFIAAIIALPPAVVIWWIGATLATVGTSVSDHTFFAGPTDPTLAGKHMGLEVLAALAGALTGYLLWTMAGRHLPRR